MRLCPCGRFWGPEWDHEPDCKLWPGSEWDRDRAGFECPPEQLQDVALWAFEQGLKWSAVADVSPCVASENRDAALSASRPNQPMKEA